MRTAFLVFLLLAAGTEPANAQSESALPAGARVRWMESHGWIEGEVQQAASRGSPIPVVVRGGVGMYEQRSRIGNMEEVGWDADRLQFRSQTGRRWRGALIGAGAGAVFGAAVGFAGGDDPPEAWFGYSAGEKAVISGSGFGLIGALIGALAAPGTHWTPVNSGGISRIGWHIGTEGVGMRVSF